MVDDSISLAALSTGGPTSGSDDPPTETADSEGVR